MKTYPGTFTVYKKLGAAQFTLLPPRVNEENCRINKNGAVLLEAAPGAGDKKYNWSSKISFALGMSDLCNMFDNPDQPQKLIHSMPGSNLVKTLEFKPGEGRYSGTYVMRLGEVDKNTKESKFVQVPLAGGEYTVLLRLLMSAAPLMIGWQ